MTATEARALVESAGAEPAVAAAVADAPELPAGAVAALVAAGMTVEATKRPAPKRRKAS